VRDQSGEEMYFKVKKMTKMMKIFEAYAQRRGMTVNDLRFMLDGERIVQDATPKMLEIEDNDQIDVMLETVGGY
jgi:small ubiquitin-related modifier